MHPVFLLLRASLIPICDAWRKSVKYLLAFLQHSKRRKFSLRTFTLFLIRFHWTHSIENTFINLIKYFLVVYYPLLCSQSTRLIEHQDFLFDPLVLVVALPFVQDKPAFSTNWDKWEISPIEFVVVMITLICVCFEPTLWKDLPPPSHDSFSSPAGPLLLWNQTCVWSLKYSNNIFQVKNKNYFYYSSNKKSLT